MTTSEPSGNPRGRPRSASARGQLWWGLVSQSSSSLTNFGLSLLAARALGPEGLGVVYIGFSLYLALLGFSRALISDPLVAVTTPLTDSDRKEAHRFALTTLLLAGFGVSLAAAGLGLLVPDPIGPGLLAFAPWILPALVQQFWRAILFQDRKGRAGALNDLVWVIVMAAVVPIALASGDVMVVVASWGLGATAAVVLGLFQAQIIPGRIGLSLQWWRTSTWAMGRWLGLESITFGVGSQILVFVIAGIVGAGPLGGLRAVQTVYAPLSLVGGALALPALPEISRRLDHSGRFALRYTIQLGGVAALLTAIYMAVAISGGGGLLAFVFGDGFSGFEELVWPVGTTQLLGAALFAFPLLLKGMQESRALFSITFLAMLVSLVAASSFALQWGVLGAAWGMALGSGLKASLTAATAVRFVEAKPHS